MPKQKAVVRSIRFDLTVNEELTRASRAGGFTSASAFIRSAVQHELANRPHQPEEADARVVASLDRVARELRSIGLRQQAEFAFLDALVKMLLTHLAELPKDAYDQAVARGKLRYERFLKSVGMGMVGDAQAAMTELLRRIDAD